MSIQIAGVQYNQYYQYYFLKLQGYRGTGAVPHDYHIVLSWRHGHYARVRHNEREEFREYSEVAAEYRRARERGCREDDPGQQVRHAGEASGFEGARRGGKGYFIVSTRRNVLRNYPNETPLQIAREHGIKFLETSAKANINIERAFCELAEAILDKISTNEAPENAEQRVIIDRKGQDKTPADALRNCCA